MISPPRGLAIAKPATSVMTTSPAPRAGAPVGESGVVRQSAAATVAGVSFDALAGPALSLGYLFQAAVPESVATFAPDCTTPKNSFNLGDTICVQVAGVLAQASRRLVLVDPSGFTWGIIPITTSSQTTTFELPSESTASFFGNNYDNRGTWRVATIDEDASARTGALLVVHDPQVLVADLTISKFKIGSAEPVAGGNISFLVYVWNGGPDPAQNVAFADTTLPNTTFQSLTQNSGPTFTCTTPTFNTPGVSNCTSASMLRGDAASFTIVYKVNDNIVNGTELTDTVSVSSETIERRSIDNSSTSTTTASNPTPNACSMACPSNIVQTAAQGQDGAIITFDTPTANNCGSGPLEVTPASGSFFAIGSSVVTATTQTGDTCSFTVTINAAEDTTAPSISCPNDISVPESSSSSNSATVAYAVTATDDSGTVNVSCNPPSGSSFLAGTTNVTCTATDLAGNSTSCAFDVTVTQIGCTLGTTPPTPDMATLPSITRACSVTLVASDIPTATDSCGGQINATTGDPLTYDAAGTYTIHWTYTDDAGNVATQEQTITVSPDTSAPVPDASSLPTLTGECAVNVASTPTATDNCGGSGILATTEDPLTYTSQGTFTVHWKFTDASNNVTIQEQMVVVDDATPPTISAPANASYSCITQVPAGNPSQATAADDCGTPSVTVSDSNNGGAGSTASPLIITRTYTAADAGGNAASAAQTITVIDAAPPTIALNGAATLTVECHTTFTDPGATASDSCDSSVPVASSGLVNTNTPGTYTITYSATDDAGNAAAPVTRTVTVVDTTKPVITRNGAAVVTHECHMPYADAGATAADSCDTSVAVVSSGAVNANVPGTYTVTYNATDDTGNAAVPVTRTVNVVDTTAPTLTLNGQTLSMWPPNNKYKTFSVTDFVTGASDGCSTTLGVSSVVIQKVTSDENDGNNDIVIAADCKSVQLRASRNGNGDGRVYTITFRLRDSAGNTTTKTAKVVVPHDQGNGNTAVDSGVHYTVTSGCL